MKNVPQWCRFAVLVVVFVVQLASRSSAVAAPPVVQRDLWSFDDSDIMFPDEATRDEAKKKNTTNGLPGWADYIIEVPKTDWYELWSTGMPAEWQRDVFVDGKLEGWMITSDPVLDRDGKSSKELNVFLTAGRHTIRFRRLDHPATLPTSWELRQGNGRPEASLRIRTDKDPIVRSGEQIVCTVESGGTSVAQRYDIFAGTNQSDELVAIGSLDFPVTAEVVNRRLEFSLPSQAVWHLVVKANGKALRPADFRAPEFFVVDTKAPKPAGTELKLTPVIEIDCVKQTINGEPAKLGENYFEQYGPVAVVESDIGSYRATNGRGAGGNWGLDAFSYRFKLPQAQVLYKLEVDYPDDDRRTMGFWVNDGAKLSTANGHVATGGVETGDAYALTHRLQTHEAFFYPRQVDKVVLAMINLTPGGKGAAASKARIYRVQEPLPAAEFAETNSPRTVGYWFEEPGRWLRHFGGENELPEEQLRSLDRWGQFARFQGARLLWPTINIYQANYYPSKVLEGYFCRPYNYMRLAGLVAERYGCEYVPEFHISGKNWFDWHRLGVWSVRKTPTSPYEIKFKSPEAEEVVIRSNTGAMGFAAQPFLFNALHPKVQQAYIDALGEAADSLADLPSFKGISSRVMLQWMWQGYNALPNLKWGYDDWTVAQFEKETGISVPVALNSPDRFRLRFEFLTGIKKQEWVDWRCKKIFDFHCRIRDRIRRAKPDANLYFTCLGIEPSYTLSRNPAEQLIESGIDPRRYKGVEGIVFVPATTFGRRYSTPSFDAVNRERSRTDLFKTLARDGASDITTCISSAYFECNSNLDWTKLGGETYAAFDSCEPSAAHERELFSQQLADVDTSTFIVGANGTFAGRPAWMRPWFERFNAIPAKRFEKVEAAQDPVAVWQSRDKDGLVFYAVNRIATPVNVSVVVKDSTSVEMVAATPGAQVDRDPAGRIRFQLEPYMLQVFRAKGDAASLGDIRVESSAEESDRLARAVSYVKELKSQLADRRVAPELSQQDAVEAMTAIGQAVTAFGQNRFAGTRDALFNPTLVRVYDGSGRYPPGLFDRQTPYGYVDAPDTPKVKTAEVVNAVGDSRGVLPSVSHLCYDDKGKLWISSGPDLMRFDEHGKYEQSLRLLDESDYLANGYRWDKLGPPVPMNLTTFAISTDGDILAPTPATVNRFEPAEGRRRDGAGGRGAWITLAAGAGPTSTAVDNAGSIYVAGKTGVFKFKSDGSPSGDFDKGTSNCVTDLAATAIAVDRSGQLFLAVGNKVQIVNVDGSLGQNTTFPDTISSIAISTDGNLIVVASESKFWVMRAIGGKPTLVANADVAGKISSVAVRQNGLIAVGLKSAADDAVALMYRLNDRSIQPAGVLVKPPAVSLPQRPTQMKAWKNRLYYLAGNQLMEFDAASAKPVRKVADFSSLGATAIAFAIAPDGALYVSTAANNAKPETSTLARADRRDDGWAAVAYLDNTQSLQKAVSGAIADLACDAQGNVLVKLAGERSKTGTRPSSIGRWNPTTGELSTVADLGELDTTLGYGLFSSADGKVFLADASARRVSCVDSSGKTLWQAEYKVHRSHGSLPLRTPVAVTVDQKGRVWVADSSANQLVCLDGRDGRFLTSVGYQGTVDETSGGLFQPSGLCAMFDETGREWLYVADVGNRRVVRYLIQD